MVVEMSGDDEILNLLRKLLSRPERRIEAKTGLEVDSVGPESPNGIYIFNQLNGKWVLQQVDGDHLKPWEDGLYVVYFDNTKCPACRAYDMYWYPFVKLFGRTFKDAHFIIVLCDWFTRECNSSAARNSFEHFDIHASPTTLLLSVENGAVKAVRKLEGVKRIDQLVEEVSKFVNESTAKGVAGSG
ncbi:hypothetical protein [Desulfurococcus mucosus]|uniref:hypothetical protein n=1 Tax=Desulfurococcus mucosus TaxID=2275 RepID=UPI00200EF0F0|nr:hypothetical protein [Desulfurococcus mucosus]